MGVESNYFFRIPLYRLFKKYAERDKIHIERRLRHLFYIFAEFIFSHGSLNTSLRQYT
ncbi:MAG: hypothetical protein BWY72_00421 [Bacteroidetes bacterium ADurb.Bin416]|nr:MAG: hypothetical protein BWY72_00421 [Bacteroidetes bacterium ADurb.Bin416]